MNKATKFTNMRIDKITYCLRCQQEIESLISFEVAEVVQSCPNCKKELGRAGTFFVHNPQGIQGKIKIIPYKGEE